MSAARTEGRRAFLVVAAALAVAVVSSCKKKEDASPETKTELPKVTDTSVGLMLTWIDEKGEFHTEEKVADVPVAAREIVRVRAVDAVASADREIVADLRAPGADGAYPVRTIPRAEFEQIAVDRRAKHGAVLAPKLAASGSAAPAGSAGGSSASGGSAGGGGPAVIIYGASWCGPCHQAAAYLRSRGIPFVEYDIEQEPARAQEMHAKLERAGKRGGSIPVLDVRGRILVGFSAAALDQALSAP